MVVRTKRGPYHILASSVIYYWTVQSCEPKMLGRFLEYCKSWKLAVSINTGSYSIRVLHEWNISDGGNLCPLWLRFLNFDVALLWAVVTYTLLDAVPWNGLEHSRRKYGDVFVLFWLILGSVFFYIKFFTSICVSYYFETDKNWVTIQYNTIPCNALHYNTILKK